MKKLSLIILLMTLMLINLNCSGGPGSSDNSGKTMVNINLGKISKASPTEKRLPKATSSIPDNVASIRFTISAPDIVTIIRVVSIAGKESISETFEISNGYNRDFLIEALDASDNVIYRKDTIVPHLDGSPIHLTIEMESTDFQSPDFAGLSDINLITTTSLTLLWLPGDDNVTPPDKLQYLVYRSDTPRGENFESPGYTTSSGATSFNVTGLSPATTYYFVVRAKDETGNIDSNSNEMAATTLSPPDTTAPDFDGVASVAAVSSTRLSLSWNPATDNITVSSDIVYNIYMSTATGGENLASPSFTTSPGVTSFDVTGLTMGATYYFIVRAKDEAGNIDSNIVERSATTQFIDLTVRASLTNPCLPDSSCPALSVSVSNNGNINADYFNGYYIYEYCNVDGCYPSCQPFSIAMILAHNSVLLSDLAAPGNDNYFIIIDQGNMITETNESNNETCGGTACDLRPSLKICQE